MEDFKNELNMGLRYGHEVEVGMTRDVLLSGTKGYPL